MTKLQIVVGVIVSLCVALTFTASLMVSTLPDKEPEPELVMVYEVREAPLPTLEKPTVSTPEPTPMPTPEPTPAPTPVPTAEPVLLMAEAKPQEPEWAFPLDDDEFITACRMVMGEAGAEPYDGMIAVAQCILAACQADGIVPSEVRTEYRYAGWKEEYSDKVERAVLAVFRDGTRVCDEEIIFFYAPKLCTSKWHETQDYVLTIGGHKFFAEKGV
jgi:hypothetical protein